MEQRAMIDDARAALIPLGSFVLDLEHEEWSVVQTADAAASFTSLLGGAGGIGNDGRHLIHRIRILERLRVRSRSHERTTEP